MENEDIFSMLDAPAPKQQKPAYNKQGGNNRDRNPYWSNKNITPIEIKRENVKQDKKAFTLLLSGRDNTVPQEAKDKILKVVRALADKGLTLRLAPGSNDHFLNEVASLFPNKEIYLPWGGYNREVKSPESLQPSELSYRVAINFHKRFLDLPDAVRTILANEANMILGKNCDNIVGFILGWSPGGDELITKDTDFKNLGNLSFSLRIAKAFSIPFLNIANKDFSAEKLSKLLG